MLPPVSGRAPRTRSPDDFSAKFFSFRTKQTHWFPFAHRDFSTHWRTKDAKCGDRDIVTRRVDGSRLEYSIGRIEAMLVLYRDGGEGRWRLQRWQFLANVYYLRLCIAGRISAKFKIVPHCFCGRFWFVRFFRSEAVHSKSFRTTSIRHVAGLDL